MGGNRKAREHAFSDIQLFCHACSHAFLFLCMCLRSFENLNLPQWMYSNHHKQMGGNRKAREHAFSNIQFFCHACSRAFLLRCMCLRSFENFKYEFVSMDEFKLFKTTINKCVEIEKHVNTHFLISSCFVMRVHMLFYFFACV